MQTVHFHYDLNGQLLAETTGSGGSIRDYLWIDNQPVAQITGMQTTYLVADHLNTPRRAFDANGSEVWRWVSDAYGNGSAEEDVDGNSVQLNVNLRFPGHYGHSPTLSVRFFPFSVTGPMSSESRGCASADQFSTP